MKSLLPLITFMVGAAGCNVERAPDRVASGASAASDACVESTRYLAIVIDAPCTEVSAASGRWVPSRLFESTAPELDAACIYAWSGVPGGLIDRAALEAHVGKGALEPYCGNAAPVRGDAMFERINQLSASSAKGTVGCDVCAVVLDSEIHALLPSANFHQFGVPLSDGSRRYYQIHADADVRAVSARLPPLPPGLRYVEGRIGIY